MTRRPTFAALLVAVALLPGLAACGDDDSSDGGRPTVDEMAAQLTEDGQLTDDQAECVARAFVDSDISDEGLRAMAEAGGADALDPGEISAEDQAAVEDATRAVIACATDSFEQDLATSTTTG